MRPVDDPPVLERREHKHRALGVVLLRRALIITLVVGLFAAAATMWIDLQREKDAVEQLVEDFTSSVMPSASAAVYNFDDVAAEQVAKGLFLSRAIKSVRILNDGDTVVDAHRELQPTLPSLAFFGSSDEVTLKRLLHEPGDQEEKNVIGELYITLDRSLVAPEFVDRLSSFFLITTGKNMLFGLALYCLIFSLLARHITTLASVTHAWRPGDGALKLPPLPKFLQRTDVEGLGLRIASLTSTASRAIDTIQQSHDAVVDDNTVLSDTVLDRTRRLEQANARLQNMADQDGLTGLYNRAYFDRFLASTFQVVSRQSGPLAILLIDVDHFKAFNDFYGHQAGDDALIRVANILKQIQADTGCLMARYGGEEFICLVSLPNVTSVQFARKIHGALEAAAIEHQHSTVAKHLSVSIGTASTAERRLFKTADDLVSAADDALYEAKFQGRNRTVVSTPKIRQRAQEQRLSLQALLRAIEERHFEPFMQPQVDARSGELVGAEALVRWVHPEGVVIAPGKFMPTAEATGLIKKIDDIVLEKIGEFLNCYPGALPNLSFNVTGDSFQDAQYLQKIVELSQASRTGITIELLETAFIDRPDDTFLWNLDMLREAGVAIEIDDFGTGRTSILGLMAINPDRLKIARELIIPLGEREEQATLVRSVIEIAQSLNTKVLAEGIETAKTAEMLIEMGCPIQQGFLHGKPMPMTDLVNRAGHAWVS